MAGRNRVFTEVFKRQAVRLSYKSGRTKAQVCADLRVGKSTMSAWRKQYREADLVAEAPHEDPTKEIARLKLENELLRQERDLLKKATAFFAQETKR